MLTIRYKVGFNIIYYASLLRKIIQCVIPHKLTMFYYKICYSVEWQKKKLIFINIFSGQHQCVCALVLFTDILLMLNIHAIAFQNNIYVNII